MSAAWWEIKRIKRPPIPTFVVVSVCIADRPSFSSNGSKKKTNWAVLSILNGFDYTPREKRPLGVWDGGPKFKMNFVRDTKWYYFISSFYIKHWEYIRPLGTLSDRQWPPSGRTFSFSFLKWNWKCFQLLNWFVSKHCTQQQRALI